MVNMATIIFYMTCKLGLGYNIYIFKESTGYIASGAWFVHMVFTKSIVVGLFNILNTNKLTIVPRVDEYTTNCYRRCFPGGLSHL